MSQDRSRIYANEQREQAQRPKTQKMQKKKRISLVLRSHWLFHAIAVLLFSLNWCCTFGYLLNKPIQMFVDDIDNIKFDDKNGKSEKSENLFHHVEADFYRFAWNAIEYSIEKYFILLFYRFIFASRFFFHFTFLLGWFCWIYFAILRVRWIRNLIFILCVGAWANVHKQDLQGAGHNITNATIIQLRVSNGTWQTTTWIIHHSFLSISRSHSVLLWIRSMHVRKDSSITSADEKFNFIAWN